MESWPSFEIDPNAIAQGKVDHVRFLIYFSYGASYGIAVPDLETRRLVRLPVNTNGWETSGWMLNPMALSPDGTAVVFSAFHRDGPWTRALCRYVLATGQVQRYPMPNELTLQVALSPDGRTMAAVSGDQPDEYSDGDVIIHLVDLETRGERRLCSTYGRPSTEGSLSWSPDGQLIAVGYEIDDTTSMATTVVDATNGTVVAHYPHFQSLGSTNGCWLSDRELVVLSFDPQGETDSALFVANVRAGSMQRFDHRPSEGSGGCYGLLDGRLVQRIRGKGIYSTGLDGSDPQLFLTSPEDLSIIMFDFAPKVAR